MRLRINIYFYIFIIDVLIDLFIFLLAYIHLGYLPKYAVDEEPNGLLFFNLSSISSIFFFVVLFSFIYAVIRVIILVVKSIKYKQKIKLIYNKKVLAVFLICIILRIIIYTYFGDTIAWILD